MLKVAKIQRCFTLREVRVGDFVAVEPIVTGASYITGMQQFVVDPNDPFKYGFLVGSS
jgi:proline racemase